MKNCCESVLWIRQYSNPQISRNLGVWCFCLLHSTVLYSGGGEEPVPAWALRAACQAQRAFLCALIRSAPLRSQTWSCLWESGLPVHCCGPVSWRASANASLSAALSYSLLPPFKWHSEVLQGDDSTAVFGFARSDHHQHLSFLWEWPEPSSQGISATFTGIWQSGA